MQLIVAEKPAVGQTICSVIGGMKKQNGYYENDKYIVSWCLGHIVELSEPKAYGDKLTLPILPKDWIFEIDSSKKAQYKVLSTLMKDKRVTEVVCATDAGREGECIFRYVYNKIGCKKPIKRLWTSSLEESAIKNALLNMKDSSHYDDLYNAGFCRAKADWIVGMNMSRLYTNLYGYPVNPITGKKTLSYGRVMTPILQMINERDDKNKNFTKEKYFTIEIDCGEFIATSERINDKDNADKIMNSCNGSSATVQSVKKENKNQKPPKLYDLTTLQREANRKFGYTAKQTLDYAQTLYESKLITYPRTDSSYITEDMEETATEVFEIACNYLPFAKNISFSPNISPNINNSKVSDHHALLPTKLIEEKNLDEIPETRRNILNLISARLLCAVSDTYKYEAISATLQCSDTNFKVTGKNDIERGWRAVYDEIQKGLKGDVDEDEKEERTVPNLSENQSFDNIKASIVEHWTSPPKPYTEDTLLSAMETAGNSLYDTDEDVEKKGLGTPATRAAAIEKLVVSGYIERKKKQLIPTDYGKKNVKAANERLKSPMLTVEWETKLQQMEKGQYSPEKFMNEISEYVTSLVKNTTSIPDDCKDLFPSTKKTFGKCPKCGSDVICGKFGYFCENKECKISIRFEEKFFEWKGVKLTEKMVVDFLTNGKTFCKDITAKSGNTFDGYIALDTSGDYAKFSVEFDKK